MSSNNFISFLLGKPKNGSSSGSKKAKNTSKSKISKSSQDSMPYYASYNNGIIEVEQGVFTKSYLIEDVNFKIASQEEQDNIFLKFGDLLNMFGHEVKAEITIFNRTIDVDKFCQKVLTPMHGDKLDEYRQESNEILLDKMTEGKNNIVKEKYLTVTMEAESYESASSAFTRLDAEISSVIKQINKVDTLPLTLEERMYILNDIYNPDNANSLTDTRTIGDTTYHKFDTDTMREQGITTKDVIAPPSITFNRDNFQLGEKYGQVLYLQQLPAFLSTDFIGDINEMPCNMLTSVHFDSLRQDKAMRFIKNQLVNINANVVDAQKKASRSGYSVDLISPDLLKAKEEADKILSDMTSRNQKMFYATVVIAHFADSLEELKKQADMITTLSQKYLCTIRKLNYQQEYGLTTALPLGYNKLAIKRLLTTESASVFLPFSAQELVHEGGFYYGLNSVSHNLILFDRTKSKNANGIILGTPGSGKSFSAKREILNALLSTDADVYIIDPEREYAPLAALLGGEVIRIAAGSKSYINPLDMDLQYADDDDPVTLKSDFICSLFETILGGRYGITQAQQSVIDRCVRQIYQPYLQYMEAHPEVGTCDKTHSPTLNDLYNLLLAQDEPEAQSIALSLERFVTGSLDTFAHRTNVNTSSRFVVYDIKDIGSGMKEMGLRVCLNDIWNKTISNKKRNRRTWFYIDEFYLLTQTPSSAVFLQEIFKRARKWGGVPTGITQNVEDLLVSKEARSILSNCDFVMMMNQSPNDKQDLARMFDISQAQLMHITNADVGQGLLYTGKSIVPFIDKYPTDTKTYRAMTSKMEDTALGVSFAEKRKQEVKSIISK